jgi:hypothetical protein
LIQTGGFIANSQAEKVDAEASVTLNAIITGCIFHQIIADNAVYVSIVTYEFDHSPTHGSHKMIGSGSEEVSIVIVYPYY